MFIEEPL